MKVHFIYADIGTYYYPNTHHGLASIFSVLKSHGHSISLHHVKKVPSQKEILRVVRKEQPDLVAFSATTNQIRYIYNALASSTLTAEHATHDLRRACEITPAIEGDVRTFVINAPIWINKTQLPPM